ncbi:hypothetical protein CYLTODRAFT_460142 [Cylindrobasidium torrendii FP15055 ss-10]|uniref:Uncharacterized protein n=1 Tax=Cylindrobasidium torrendii FP15055 ss-10 TaxID=1314674 RepID=A0A0D7ASV3_9AGAR|nr:hypothetical protein CYLTODRAFT_460142 [Cylindrobasidium torrendii FP15055 ss-10]
MPRTPLPLRPRVPFAAVSPHPPLSRAWLRSFNHRYSALPAELKEEIAIWAILIIRDALKKDIKKTALRHISWCRASTDSLAPSVMLLARSYPSTARLIISQDVNDAEEIPYQFPP